MKRPSVWVAVPVAMAVLAVVAAAMGFLWWPTSAAPIDVPLVEITGIRIQPVPEGPTLYWPHPPTSPPNADLAAVEAAIPDPLPGPISQPIWCTVGGNLIIEIADGRSITYGPCRHPASIRALWATLVRLQGPCVEPCAPFE